MGAQDFLLGQQQSINSDPLMAQAQNNIAAPNPLDEVKTYISGMADSEKARIVPAMQDITDVKQAVDSMPGTGGAREKLYALMKTETGALSGRRAELIKQMATDQPLSKPQTAAMLLIGLLPTLVGRAVGGNRGGAAGAQAGALGSQTMAKGLEAQQGKAEKRALLEVNAIDEAITKKQDLMGKAQLDEINAADTATQKGLDRQTTLASANIRAGGDKSIGEGLKAQAAASTEEIKQQRIDAAKTKQEARMAPYTFGGKVYTSTGSLTDDDRKELRQVMPAYKIADKNLTELARLSSSMDAGAIERAWKDNNSELSQRRRAIVNAMKIVKEVPGRGGEFMSKDIEAMIANPTSIYQNFASQLPGKTGIPDSLLTARKLLREDAEITLSSKGADQIVSIGDAKYIDGQVKYFLGYDRDGNAMVTTDKKKAEDLQDALEQ